MAPEFGLYTGGQKPAITCKCDYEDRASRESLKGLGIWNAAMKVWLISGDRYETLKTRFLDLPDSYLQLPHHDYKKQDKDELSSRPVTVTGVWYSIAGGAVYTEREKLKEMGCIFSGTTKSWLVPSGIYDVVMRSVLGVSDHTDGDIEYPKKSKPEKSKKEPETVEKKSKKEKEKEKEPVSTSPEEEERPRVRLMKSKK